MTSVGFGSDHVVVELGSSAIAAEPPGEPCAEANYPWDLHRKIGQAGIGCDALTANPSAGRFHVRRMTDDSTLTVVSHDRLTGKVTGIALASSGRMASDTWTVECPR